jgi:hypothetical protein
MDKYNLSDIFSDLDSDSSIILPKSIKIKNIKDVDTSIFMPQEGGYLNNNKNKDITQLLSMLSATSHDNYTTNSTDTKQLNKVQYGGTGGTDGNFFTDFFANLGFKSNNAKLKEMLTDYINKKNFSGINNNLRIMCYILLELSSNDILIFIKDVDEIFSKNGDKIFINEEQEEEEKIIIYIFFRIIHILTNLPKSTLECLIEIIRIITKHTNHNLSNITCLNDITNTRKIINIILNEDFELVRTRPYDRLNTQHLMLDYLLRNGYMHEDMLPITFHDDYSEGAILPEGLLQAGGSPNDPNELLSSYITDIINKNISNIELNLIRMNRLLIKLETEESILNFIKNINTQFNNFYKLSDLMIETDFTNIEQFIRYFLFKIIDKLMNLRNSTIPCLQNIINIITKTLPYFSDDSLSNIKCLGRPLMKEIIKSIINYNLQEFKLKEAKLLFNEALKREKQASSELLESKNLLSLSIDELIAGNFSNIDSNLDTMFSLLDELNSRNILDFTNHFCTLFKTMLTVKFIHDNNKIMVFFFLYSIKEEVMKLDNLTPFILKNIIAFFINDDLKYLTKKINELLTSTQKDSPQEEIHDMLIYYQQDLRYKNITNVKYKKDMKFIDDIIINYIKQYTKPPLDLSEHFNELNIKLKEVFKILKSFDDKDVIKYCIYMLFYEVYNIIDDNTHINPHERNTYINSHPNKEKIKVIMQYYVFSILDKLYKLTNDIESLELIIKYFIMSHKSTDYIDKKEKIQRSRNLPVPAILPAPANLPTLDSYTVAFDRVYQRPS